MAGGLGLIEASTQAPQDVMKVADQYYVLATSVLADHETRVLKQGETFAIFDPYGDVQPVTHAESGIYHRGTRYVSKLELTMNGDQRPLLLNSTLRDDNGLLKVDMTNRDLRLPGTGFVAKGTLYVHREKFLLDSKCFEQIEIVNYGAIEVETDITFRLSADFADIFEVRGTRRERRGTLETSRRDDNRVLFFYKGLDGITRITCFAVKGAGFKTEAGVLRMDVRVPAGGRFVIHTEISFHEVDERTTQVDYRDALARIHSDHHAGRKKYCSIRSSNEQFDSWMRRSTDDLVMMTTPTPEGDLYPYAGIPWFCTPFGRDGIVTALECLWANPSLARGVLRFLSKTQADEHSSERDATPGKIIHEIREGEMAHLKEIPFGRYYGSVDSTPLFLCLAGAYHTRSNDLELLRELWPSYAKALAWLDDFGDLDGDGFVEYQRENPNGLVQQGWKDSTDSVFHADGKDARGPIALCEVQAYAYLARLEGAKLARALGHAKLAGELEMRAAELRERFDRAFWLEDLGTYALALDGDKRPCRVKNSNAGQCLFTGIVKPERARALVDTLMAPESFSGWGIRTIATDVRRHNPMSYHNGSVWPHDVALIAWGMARYGFADEVERLFNGLYRGAIYMEMMRMPEVFCGFERRDGEAPTLYPHACAPQAWAAGSVYLMLQALLGLEIDSTQKKVQFSHPRLPDSIESLRISNLGVDGTNIDIIVQNYHSDVSVQLSRRGTGISVTVEK